MQRRICNTDGEVIVMLCMKGRSYQRTAFTVGQDDQHSDQSPTKVECSRCYSLRGLGLSGRYTVRCNRADIAVRVSSYNDIEP